MTFISSASRLGKVERLLWVTAQARKIHSPICNDALWCIKASGKSKARGANPLTCTACQDSIRAVCPAYQNIRSVMVSFNHSAGAAFKVATSAGNAQQHGQRFLTVKRTGVLDSHTAQDCAEMFNQYPVPQHQDGASITVEEFVNFYST
jgi:hypothetical protein